MPQGDSLFTRDLFPRRWRPAVDQLTAIAFGICLPMAMVIHAIALFITRSGRIFARLSSYEVHGFDATLGGILQLGLAASMFCIFWLGRPQRPTRSAYLIGVPAGFAVLIASIWLYARSP